MLQIPCSCSAVKLLKVPLGQQVSQIAHSPLRPLQQQQHQKGQEQEKGESHVHSQVNTA